MKAYKDKNLFNKMHKNSIFISLCADVTEAGFSEWTYAGTSGSYKPAVRLPSEVLPELKGKSSYQVACWKESIWKKASVCFLCLTEKGNCAKLSLSINALKENSNCKQAYRELPVGGRQLQANGELAPELSF